MVTLARKQKEPSRSSGLVRRFGQRLPQYLRTVRRDPAWIAMFVGARFVVARRIARAVGRAAVGRWSQAGADGAGRVLGDADAIVPLLDRDGVAQGLRLSPDTLEAIRAFTEVAPCCLDADPHRPVVVAWNAPPGGTPPDALIADYRDGIRACPALTALETDPLLLRIAAAHLRHTPILKRARLWWTFAGSTADASGRSTFSVDHFHFDLDDWLCVKFFFYVNAVDRGSGPHAIVRGSHRRRPLRTSLTPFKGVSRAVLEATYPAQAFLLITGEAGSGFAEDPFCFHTGTSPLARDRLMLEIEYGISHRLVAGPYGAPT
jgi:hypothetical protein